MAKDEVFDLGDGIYLSTDRYNFILNKKTTNAYVGYAFYGTIQSLYYGLINQKFKDKPELLFNLEAAIKEINSTYEKIVELSKTVKKDIPEKSKISKTKESDEEDDLDYYEEESEEIDYEDDI